MFLSVQMRVNVAKLPVFERANEARQERHTETERQTRQHAEKRRRVEEPKRERLLKSLPSLETAGVAGLAASANTSVVSQWSASPHRAG
jgi:hypothetical protein